MKHLKLTPLISLFFYPFIYIMNLIHHLFISLSISLECPNIFFVKKIFMDSHEVSCRHIKRDKKKEKTSD